MSLTDDQLFEYELKQTHGPVRKLQGRRCGETFALRHGEGKQGFNPATRQHYTEFWCLDHIPSGTVIQLTHAKHEDESGPSRAAFLADEIVWNFDGIHDLGELVRTMARKRVFEWAKAVHKLYDAGEPPRKFRHWLRDQELAAASRREP